MITVFIEYTIDPSKLAEFEAYAQRLLDIIPNCGGNLIGYFLPHEGTSNIGYGLVSFPNLAEYEAYRARLRQDEPTIDNFKYAADHRIFVSERRTFLRNVERG